MHARSPAIDPRSRLEQVVPQQIFTPCLHIICSKAVSLSRALQRDVAYRSCNALHSASDRQERLAPLPRLRHTVVSPSFDEGIGESSDRSETKRYGGFRLSTGTEDAAPEGRYSFDLVRATHQRAGRHLAVPAVPLT